MHIKCPMQKFFNKRKNMKKNDIYLMGIIFFFNCSMIQSLETVVSGEVLKSQDPLCSLMPFVEGSSKRTFTRNPLFKESGTSLCDTYGIDKEKKLSTNETVGNSSPSDALLVSLCLSHFAYCMPIQQSNPLPRDAKYQQHKKKNPALQKYEKRPLVSVKKNKGNFSVTDTCHFQRKR